MGRTKQTIRRKLVDFSTPKKREAWNKSLQGMYWKDFRTQYKAKDRLWVTTTLTQDLYMVNPSILKDEDGDEVYKVIFVIEKDGRPKSEHGNIRSFDSLYIPTKNVRAISDEHATQVDKWLATVKEDVVKENERGWRFSTIVIEPLKLDIPGWERLSESELKQRQTANIRALITMMNF